MLLILFGTQDRRKVVADGQFICPKCGTTESIFGEGGGSSAAEEFDLPLLGRISLKQDLREAIDS